MNSTAAAESAHQRAQVAPESCGGSFFGQTATDFRESIRVPETEPCPRASPRDAVNPERRANTDENEEK